ncbi:hypothetical protein U0Y45_08230 [Enterobacter hormaechei]
MNHRNCLDILIHGLQNNFDCRTMIIFDNNEVNTDSSTLLPWIEQTFRGVRDLRHLQLMQQARTN